MKSLAEQRSKNMKMIQEKMKLKQKEAKRFNPVSPNAISSFLYVSKRSIDYLSHI